MPHVDLDILLDALVATSLLVFIVFQVLQKRQMKRKSNSMTASLFERDGSEVASVVLDLTRAFRNQSSSEPAKYIEIRRLNRAASRLTRSYDSQKSYAVLIEFLQSEYSTLVASYFEAVEKGARKWSAEVSTKYLTKEHRHLYILANVAKPDKLDAVVFNVIDITSQKQQELYAESRAFQDPLTGLQNRAYFDRQVELEISRAKRQNKQAAVLFVDLDKFKPINDTYGHDSGDQVLCEISQRLQDVVRSSDVVCRLGGDEFTVLVSDVIDSRGLRVFAEKLLDAVSKPIQLSSADVMLSASIGISIFPGDAFNCRDLLKAADIALYEAKKSGRNAYRFFSKQMQDDILKKRELETQLQLGIENNEFFCVYQPIFELSTNQICGLELFVRWKHPSRGVLEPAEFLSAAEDSGQILPLGQWILDEALSTLEALSKHDDSNFSLAVNLSDLQLRDESFYRYIKSAVQKKSVDLSRLSFEISESGVMSSWKLLNQHVAKLRELGIQMILDDFGIGLASLNNLRHLSLSKIKIDTSLTQSALESNDSRAVVDAILLAVQNLKIDVIVEGIETKEQLEFFKKKGCQFGQGFYFAEPLTFPEWTDPKTKQRLEKYVQEH